MTETDLRALCGLYGFTEGDLRPDPHPGGWSESFLVDRGSRGFVLRVGPPGRDPGDLERLLSFQERHADLGSPVVRPVRSRRNRLVEGLPCPGNRSRPVSVLERFPGAGRETLAKGELPDEVFREIGRALARFHETSRALGPSPASFPDWLHSENRFNIPGLPWFADRAVVDAYFRYRERCRKDPGPPEASGLIHGDLRFRSVLVDTGTGAIAFRGLDGAYRGPFRMDLALLAFDLGIILDCGDRDEEATRLTEILLDGYTEGRAGARIALSDLSDFVKLLEASLYIQCFEEQDGDPGTWIRRFYRDRRRRVAEDLPWPPGTCKDLVPDG